MSQSRSPDGIGEEDLFLLKVLKVVSTEVRIMFYHILNWGCPRDLSVSFERHAKDVLKMSNRKFHNHFDDSMIQKMANNPAGDKFDLSLLYACIRHTCDQIDQSDKETLFKPIKDFRNDLIHNSTINDESSMSNALLRLREDLVKAVQKAGEVYMKPKTEVDDLISSMDENIKRIKECPLPIVDINTYKEQVKRLRKANESVVQDKGARSLRNNFKALSKVDPASWISGKERLSVQKVYIQLDIILKVKDADVSSSSHNVGHEDLLQVKTEDNNSPTFVVVEGEAGSGKSTLAKLILAQWADFDETGLNIMPSIKGLDEYELVLYVECRNQTISNLFELLETLMPQVSYEMTDKDFERSVLAKRTLVVVDGLDEMNDKSESLLKELFGSCLQKVIQPGSLHFIITTRPLNVQRVYKLCGNHPCVYLKITGIPTERRVQFVQTLHDEMCKKGQSKESTDLLVDYMKQSQCRLGDHYRLPLNLTLLTYLWASDPDRVNSVTSATTLYLAVLKLLELRVCSRLETAVETENVPRFLNLVFEVYLDTLKHGSMQLSVQCQYRLTNECEKLGLPFDDMCGAFFVVNDEWTCYGSKFYLSAPHKSIMEFFGAHRIYNCLVDEKNFIEEVENLRLRFPHRPIEVPESNPKTLEEIISKLLSEDEDLDSIEIEDYQNVFVHLVGLMAVKDKNTNILKEYGAQLIEVLERSEVSSTQWLDMVAETDCNQDFTRQVTQQISNNLVVRDGHTGAALQMFKDLISNIPVQVILQTEVKYIPKLDELMAELSQRDCSVELLLNNHWKNPMNGVSTPHLNKLVNKTCRLTRFTGNLDSLKNMPGELENLRLTISSDDQALKICDDLAKLGDQLDYLGVHILKDVSASKLKPLPITKPINQECGTIWLSEVGDADIDHSFEILRVLLPLNGKFQSVMFPRCRLSEGKFRDLLTKMQNGDIQISKGIRTDSLNLDEKDVKQMKDLVRKSFKCQFQRGDESSVW